MNMFAVLDALKNIKASVKNDFSTFRRAGQFLTRFSDMKQQEESQSLSMFLASHDKITEELKTRLAVIANYDELIIDIITTCINYYENNRYLGSVKNGLLVTPSSNLTFVPRPNISRRSQCKNQI